MFSRIRGWIFRTTVGTVLVGVALVLSVIFLFVGTSVFGGTESVAVIALVVVGFAELGFVAAAFAFLFASDRGDEYVSYGMLDRRDAIYAVGGTFGLYALAVTATVGVRVLGGTMVQTPPSDVVTSEFRNGLLALVALSVLVIGPSEELFFRGVVQSYLDGAFSRGGAIVVTSVLFAAVHVPTFTRLTTGVAVWVVAAEIFAISVVLGYLYVRTDNLVVPAIVHGVYDATLFGAAYLALRMGLL